MQKKEENTRVCLFCGRDFTPNTPTQKYCGRICGSRGSAKQRADSRRGTGNGRYVVRDGIYEHRWVMQRVIGRELLPGEIVHHWGDSRDNRPELLAIMDRSAHCSLHQPDLIAGRRLAKLVRPPRRNPNRND